jgi:hypothetical protein
MSMRIRIQESRSQYVLTNNCDNIIGFKVTKKSNNLNKVSWNEMLKSHRKNLTIFKINSTSTVPIPNLKTITKLDIKVIPHL